MSTDNTNQIPNHISIVMDGNGRWANKRMLPRIMGHRRGVEIVKDVLRYCNEYDISYLSLFAFSTENWKRSTTEVNQLMNIFIRSLRKEAKQLNAKGIKLVLVGNRTELPQDLQDEVRLVEELTKNNDKLTLILCANYGGRWDIVNACKEQLKAVLDGQIQLKEINQESFAKYLQLVDYPEPDLLIRTSGEKRISNYFLWQLAYTELYFCDTLWPDFSREDFKLAIQAYANRERRFGGVVGEVEQQKAL